MNHYAIGTTEIFIDPIESQGGWSMDRPERMRVNNCAWRGEVVLWQVASEQRIYADPVWIDGDKDKMMRDHDAVRIALQTHLGRGSVIVLNRLQS
ncbi:MAG: hypothetical protein HQL49_11215 [Gammaproteobacteria bacterium]|nr:hypothetical protein [Gammaproteobacteria bacterium]